MKTPINFEVFFEHSRDMLCLLTPDGEIKGVSPSFEKILGAVQDNEREALWNRVHPEDRSKTIGELKRGATSLAEMNFENRLLNRYGAYRRIEWYVYPRVSQGLLYAVLRDVTEHHEIVAQLRGSSLHDDLTHLYNRRGFFVFGENYLNLIPREQKILLLLRLDMQDLDAINQTQGHPEGDRLLVQTARRLNAVFRKTDILARIGGRSFGMLALVNHRDEIHLLVKRMKKEIASLSLPGKPSNSLYSMSCTESAEGVSLTSLLSKARQI